MPEQSEERRLAAALRMQKVAVTTADQPLDSDVREFISTQCAVLDATIGWPGIPVGRVTTIVGNEASGKSTVALHILAETQARGGTAVYADTERRYDRARGERIGIDSARLISLTGDTVEEIFRSIKKLVVTHREADKRDLLTIAWDSYSGTPTEDELEGKDTVAGHAKAMSRAMRELAPMLGKHRVALVLVVQYRENLSFGAGTFFRADTKTFLAYRPIRFHSTVMMAFAQIGKVGDAREPTGIEVEAKNIKNTVAPPYRQCQFRINFLDGIDQVDAKLTVALKLGEVTRNGSWYVYLGENFRANEFGVVLDAVPELDEKITKAAEAWQP